MKYFYILLISLCFFMESVLGGQISVTINLSSNDLTITEIDEYQLVGLPDCNFLFQEEFVGKPMLAVKNVSILLPPNSTAQTATITVKRLLQNSR